MCKISTLTGDKRQVSVNHRFSTQLQHGWYTLPTCVKPLVYTYRWVVAGCRSAGTAVRLRAVQSTCTLLHLQALGHAYPFGGPCEIGPSCGTSGVPCTWATSSNRRIQGARRSAMLTCSSCE